MIRRSLFPFLLLATSSLVLAAEPEISPLAALAQQAPNASAWVLAPLDRAVPGDIRQNLTFLREDLLDESKVKPKAGPEAYRIGYLLCNGMIAVLDERDQALVRAGVTTAQANANSVVTNQALEARRNYMTSWPQYFREGDQRNELQRQADNKVALTKERPKVEWADRCAQLRPALDALYIKYREALRQSPEILKSIASAAGSAPHPDGATPPDTVAKTPETKQPALVATAKTTSLPGPATGTTPTGKTPAVGGSPGQTVIQVMRGNQPAVATVLVTEAHPQEEESLIAEGPSDDGKFSFKSNPELTYNIYVILAECEPIVKKDQTVTGAISVSLRPDPAGTTTFLAQKGVGFSVLDDDRQDIVPTRANQGSPPFQWLMEVGTSGAIVEASGAKRSTGEFWLKHGEGLRVSRDGQSISCHFIGSIARKYCILEFKKLQH
ncbi:MAG: hypothetical protein P4L99_14995 [Chthoniobacter sp.]|nr:hypothetical protein [Chthoniobacter sp.]